jgi:hypothetical protein
MGLVTIADIEDATGIEVLPEDEPKIQHLINSITSYINTYCDTSFGEEREATSRVQADYYGMIELPLTTTDVSSVKNWRNSEEISYWDWDGMRTVYNLCGHETVDVTFTYGYSSVPEDIKNVAIDMVKAAFLPPDDSDVTQFMVGDVMERYFKGPISQLVDGIGLRVLNSYKPTEGTWRLGGRVFNPPGELPTI